MKTPLKIYHMNENDWWADFDLSSAITNYKKYCSDSEITIDARELQEAEMKRLRVRYPDEDETMTFAEELQYRIAVGKNGPQFFARTSYC